MTPTTVIDIVVANLSIQLEQGQDAGCRDSIVREQTPEEAVVHGTMEEAIGVEVAYHALNRLPCASFSRGSMD